VLCGGQQNDRAKRRRESYHQRGAHTQAVVDPTTNIPLVSGWRWPHNCTNNPTLSSNPTLWQKHPTGRNTCPPPYLTVRTPCANIEPEPAHHGTKISQTNPKLLSLACAAVQTSYLADCEVGITFQKLQYECYVQFPRTALQ
jgi:hypothetical protein